MASSGSLRQRSDGKYELTVSCGFDANGKRIRKYKTVEATSERAAKKQLALFVAEVDKGTYIDYSKISTQAYFEKWLTEYVEPNLSNRTQVDYKDFIHKRAIPALGHIHLQKLKPLHILAFYNNLAEDGMRDDGKPGKLSSRTILKFHKILSAALRDAVEWQMLEVNPCSRIKPPRVTKTITKYYDEVQLIELMRALSVEPLKYQALVYIAMTTGMRRGEIVALTWEDIWYDKNQININKATEHVAGQKQTIKTTKTPTSIRTVPIPDITKDILRKHYSVCAQDALKEGRTFSQSNYIFTGEDPNAPIHANGVSRWFSRFIQRHNLPPITLHGLRHSAASIWIAKGLNLKTVSSILGHAQTSTTLDIYTHLIKSSTQEAADIMGDIFTIKEDKMTKQG